MSPAGQKSQWYSPQALVCARCLLLTHRGRVTHICVGNLTIIGSHNGLSPRRRQAIIWSNAGELLIEPLGTILSEISIAIQTFSSKKMYFKMSSTKWRPFCLGLSVLTHLPLYKMAAISRTIFSDAFLWMKSFVFWLKFPFGNNLSQCWPRSVSPCHHMTPMGHSVLTHHICFSEWGQHWFR